MTTRPTSSGLTGSAFMLLILISLVLPNTPLSKYWKFIAPRSTYYRQSRPWRELKVAFYGKGRGKIPCSCHYDYQLFGGETQLMQPIIHGDKLGWDIWQCDAHGDEPANLWEEGNINVMHFSRATNFSSKDDVMIAIMPVGMEYTKDGKTQKVEVNGRVRLHCTGAEFLPARRNPVWPFTEEIETEN